MADNEEDTPKGPQDEVFEKAKFSEVVGGLLVPVAKELIVIEKAGIAAAKKRFAEFRKKRLLESNKSKITEGFSPEESPLKGATKFTKMAEVFEKASEQEIENDDVLKLWSSLIDRVNERDPDLDLLLEKLESITPAEAALLINFHLYRRVGLAVHPGLRRLRAGWFSLVEMERERGLAISLYEKGIIRQPAPVKRILAMHGIAALLVFSGVPYVLRTLVGNGFPFSTFFAGAGGALGVMSLGLWLFVSTPPPLQLSWIGRRLYEGAQRVSDEK